MKLKHVLIALLAVLLVSCGITAVVHAATTNASCTGGPITTTATKQTFSVACSVPRPPATTVTATVTASPTPTPTSSGSPSPTPTPTPTATPTTGTWACVVQKGAGCPDKPGPNGESGYLYDQIPMSNGYNTYVESQDVGSVGGTETLSANNPGDWQVLSNLPSCGGCVQMYDQVQQLTNNWNPTAHDFTGSADLPMDSLATFKVNYTETSPATGASYEYAPDIWTAGYPSDVMFWVDTVGRCNTGAYGSTLLGHATFAGQNWTVHRYGGTGGEIIFVLDGAGGAGTCATQPSGSVDVKAGLAWLSALPSTALGGDYPDHPALPIVASGWEITQSSNATFRLTGYSITAN